MAPNLPNKNTETQHHRCDSLIPYGMFDADSLVQLSQTNVYGWRWVGTYTLDHLIWVSECQTFMATDWEDKLFAADIPPPSTFTIGSQAIPMPPPCPPTAIARAFPCSNWVNFNLNLMD